MRNNALCKAGELTPPIREAFESVLGRRLGDDEAVSIHAYPPRPAPTGQERADAYRRLLEAGEKFAQRVKNVPEQEIDAAVDEAVDYVHRHPA
ncbi:MAG TPA: hypothetical protein VKV17_17830 [Bryobacteraceae bacterium]|nr:hypothetical protein [Bryobacteraceae bacterium]